MGPEEKTFSSSRGNMMVAVFFVVFASFVGLTLLTHTITQNRIIKFRIKKIRETDRIQQEVIHYLHCFRETILARDLSRCTRPETDYFNQGNFPEWISGEVKIENHFHHLAEEKHGYRKIRITDRMEARMLNGHQVMNAEAVIDLLSGNIPLNLIPLLVKTQMDIPPDEFQEQHHIQLHSPGIFFMSDLPIEFDVTSFLIDALKIRGDILNWLAVRERFGFEISPEPIETGIYFMVENNVLESIFIQGDVQRLVFSIRNDLQVIQFYFEGNHYELCYQPGEHHFQSWVEGIPEETIFIENIIVNGNLWTLEQEGGNAFHEEANIKLLVSGQTIIRTALLTENLDLKKMKLTRLTLMAGVHQLYGPGNEPPGITVDTGANTEIQATLMVDGTIKTTCPELELRGSLFAREIQNQGQMTIHHMGSAWDSGSYFHTGTITLIFDFFIPCIEEVYHDA